MLQDGSWTIMSASLTGDIAGRGGGGRVVILDIILL